MFFHLDSLDVAEGDGLAEHGGCALDDDATGQDDADSPSPLGGGELLGGKDTGLYGLFGGENIGNVCDLLPCRALRHQHLVLCELWRELLVRPLEWEGHVEGQRAEVVPVLASLLVALVQDCEDELGKVAQMRRLRTRKTNVKRRQAEKWRLS
jgi:hypothetical protein